MMDYRIILEEFPEAVFVADIETGIIVYANKSAEKLIGLPREQIIGLHQSQLHPPEDVDIYKNIFNEDIRTEHNFPVKRKTEKKFTNLYAQHISGKKIPIQIFSKIFEYNNKSYIIGLFIDIKKIKKLEKRILELMEILTYSENSFKQGSFQYFYNVDNSIVVLSHGAKKILKLKKNFIRFHNLIDMVIPEQKEKFTNFFKNVSKSNNFLNKREEFIFFYENQNYILDFQLFFKRKQYLYGIIKDITEEKTKIKEIEDKNRHLRMLSECHKVLMYAIEEKILLKQICKVIVETGGYILSWIGYKKFDSEKNIEIVTYYTKNLDLEDYVKNLHLNWREDNPFGLGPAGISCREGKIDIEQNVWQSKRFEPIRDIVKKNNIQSIAGLPIFFNERVIGTLVIYSPYPDAFQKEEIEILKELSLNLGIGIHLLREIKSKLKLLEQNILLTKVLDNTNVAIVVVSQNGKILYVNKKFEDITGYLMNEVLGMDISILKSGLHDNEFYKNIWQTLLNKKDWKGEIINKRKNGSLFLCRSFISPIYNDTGEISHYIQILEDITLEKYYQEQIEKTKYFDSLTNLPNRIYFLERVNQEIINNRPFYLLYIDIDHFSQITHSIGYVQSDDLLREFAVQLKIFTEEYKNCLLARLGNDEFGILLIEYTIDKVISFVENLLIHVRKNYQVLEKEYFLLASVGISIFPDNATQTEELLRLAEIALKRSKEEKGDGNFAFLTKDTEKNILQKSRIETILNSNIFNIQAKEKSKIEKTGFYLEYQPIVDIQTQKIISLEALIRWKNPELGMVSPALFIPIAEKNKLIIPLGEFIIEEVLKQIIEWENYRLPLIPVGINISYIQLQHKEFIQKLKYLLDYYQVDPSLIELEITENAILQEEEIARKILQELKNMNIKLLIDDFGIGYSSLSYLLKYKFDIIKIDQIFIKELTNSSSQNALNLVRSIIQISKNLNLKTIAEGVETKEQFDILIKERCDYAQGFYFYKPLLPDRIIEIIKK